MRMIVATLKSTTPMAQSKYHRTEKLEKELSDAYEDRSNSASFVGTGRRSRSTTTPRLFVK